MPRLGKFHRLTTREERGTQDWGRESTRLVNKQLSDLWKIPTPEGHSISEPGRIQPVKLGGAVSVIFGSQVSLRVHYCK